MPYFPQNEEDVALRREALVETLLKAGNVALSHPLPRAIGKILHADQEAAQKIWGYTPEQIGDDVLERTGSPVAATTMHLGREFATPLNTAFSLYGPAKEGIKGLMDG